MSSPTLPLSGDGRDHRALRDERDPVDDDAGTFDLVIAADASELAAARAATWAWLTRSDPVPPIAGDVLLAMDELVNLAIEASDPGEPIEVRLRRTHSLVAVEVSCHAVGASAADLRDRFDDVRPDLGLRVVRSLANRTAAQAGAHRVSMSCTFHISPLGA